MTRVAITATALLAALAAFSGRARAQDIVNINAPLGVASATPIADSIGDAVAATLAADPQDARPVAIEYSDAHLTRAKIHKYASWATIPLLGTEFWLGEKLYNDPNSLTSNLRGVHGAVGVGLIGFFAVQSVTGAWNMIEAKSAPGHTKRLVHGLMMLAAEGGLVAAAASAPGTGRNNLVNFDANAATHRDIAIASIGLGTAGYLFMLLTGGSH
jgi:hypothetical protein